MNNSRMTKLVVGFLCSSIFSSMAPGGLGINVNADTTIKSKQKIEFLSMCLLICLCNIKHLIYVECYCFMWSVIVRLRIMEVFRGEYE